VTARALARDLDRAFPGLVVEFQDGIYSGVRRLVPTAADAEDITQETFVRAYRALAGYPEERIRDLRPAAWLWTIALNLCRNAARARSRRPAGSPLESAPEPADLADTAEAAVQAVTDEKWRMRLGTLTESQRTAVVLRHVVGLPYADIAAALERPVGTVKADVHRGLSRLRASIASEPKEQI
jgi:RNA polymerase sigma factor (sigma-70 family)